MDELPDDRDLDALFRGATRLEVITDRILLTETDLSGLREACRVEAPRRLARCMCGGDFRMRFYGPEGERAVLSMHHGHSLRWDPRWNSDAPLQDGRRALEWFAQRGLPAPLQAFEESERSYEPYRQAWRDWCAAAPPGTPDLDPVRGVPFIDEDFAASALQAVLAANGRREAMLGLLSWLGHAGGPWTGFAAHEGLPLTMLEMLPLPEVERSLIGETLTPQLLEGMARLIAMGDQSAPIFPGLLARLHEHLSGDLPKSGRLRRKVSA